MIRRRRIAVCSFALPLVFAAVPALAQPADPPEDRPRGPSRERSPEELVERIEQRIAELDALRARLADASAAIKEGVEPFEAIGPAGMHLLDRGFSRGADGPGLGREGLTRGDHPRRGDGPLGPSRDSFDPERGPDRRLEREVTDEETLAFIDTNMPRLAARLKIAENLGPEKAERLLGRLKNRLRPAILMQERDPVFATLVVSEIQNGLDILMSAQRLGQLINAGDDPAARLAVEDEIRELLGKQFDLKQQLDAHRLERSVEEIERLSAEIEQRAADRERILEDQFDRISTRAARGRGFGPPSGLRQGHERGRGRGRD